MGLFEGISKLAGLSTFVTAVGFLVHLVGYGAPYWIKDGSSNFGLWKYCSQKKCIDVVGDDFPTEGWMEAVQAFETLAFLANLATLALMGLRFTVMKEQKILPIGIILFQFASVGLILLGVIIFGVKSPFSTYGFAFGFEITSANMILVAGIFSFVDWRSTSLPAVKQ
ncbi:uncharacterized protein [Mytilus edulis]|uniref:uncharacterized protein n=1 Tax=Mytilus edulis TaxID=6550 RepID=UPI0039EED64E